MIGMQSQPSRRKLLQLGDLLRADTVVATTRVVKVPLPPSALNHPTCGGEVLAHLCSAPRFDHQCGARSRFECLF